MDTYTTEERNNNSNTTLVKVKYAKSIWYYRKIPKIQIQHLLKLN